jgi:hypothetical protein
VLCEKERHGWINPVLFSRVCEWVRDERFQITLDISGYGYRSPHEARNVVTNAFLNSEAGFLMMIDNDTVPKSCLPEMALADRAIIAARVPVYGGGWNVYHLDGVIFKEWNNAPSIVSENIDAVGTAAICIRKDVFYSMRDDQPGLPFWMAKHSVDGRMLLGEDLLFCSRVKDLGYELFVAEGHDCGHLRTMDLANGIR